MVWRELRRTDEVSLWRPWVSASIRPYIASFEFGGRSSDSRRRQHSDELVNSLLLAEVNAEGKHKC